MISAILSILTSGGFGVITGLVGAAITKYQELQLLKIKNAHEIALGELSLREIEAETQRDVIIADKKIDLAEAEGFQNSLKPSSKLGERVKAIVRPAITIYLLIITSWLAYNVWHIVQGFEMLSQEEMVTMMKDLIQQIIFLTSTAVGWWFAARPSHRTTK